MNAETLAASLLTAFDQRQNHERPFIAVIDGLGGAGKTTVAEALVQQITPVCPVQLIHMDDLIEVRIERYHTGRPEWEEYYFLQWDCDKIADDLFKPLHAGCEELVLQFYDKETDDTFEKKIHVKRDGMLLVEGVFLQRLQWRHYYDYVVFADCPFALRRARVLERDAYIGSEHAILAKYETRYWPAEAYYEKTILPKKQANAVIKVNSY